MIKWFNKQRYIIKFFICALLLINLLLLTRIVFDIEPIEKEKYNLLFKKRNIEDVKDNYNISVYYPKFTNPKLNKIVTDYIYNYIIDFKKQAKESTNQSTLKINYSFYSKENYGNIFFNIENSLNPNDKTKNILLDLTNDSLGHISNLYEESFIKDNINKLVNKKYSSYVSSIVQNNDINTFNYEITDNFIKVYFDKSIFDSSINYNPYIIISLTDEAYYEEIEVDKNKKLIAFTFDDGPSKVTLDIVEALKLNKAKGTFFMLGNKMRNYSTIVKHVYSNGNEIGNHTFSHKNLTKISQSEIYNQINYTNKIYNELTGDNIKYIRPPYSEINSNAISIIDCPVIKWSIDPRDWLVRNSQIIANHILERVYDGGIILMHDVYPETAEALKIVLPKLKELGYEAVTISELAQYKNKTLSKGQIIREIK